MSHTRKYIVFLLLVSFFLMLAASLSKLCFWALALENFQQKMKGE